MKQFNNLTILAIETSCDDTCIAVLEAFGKTRPHFKVLSNIISSQVKIHKKWGGVYPSLAKREHQKNLPIVLKKALKKAKNSKIDLIAVTIGPGLEPCLWVGVNFAKDLARNWGLFVIPVNHIEAHILANWLKIQEKIGTVPFPAICLIVSGGHTQLILMKNFGKYKILGETRDDAAGECFDKVARILGLGYPGGPLIEKEAEKFKKKKILHLLTTVEECRISLPRPMIHQKNYDFSFSGLKTAVLYKIRSMKYEETKKKEFVREMCKETQQAIIDVLIYKTLRAAKEFKAKTIILGGGVTANYELRKQLKKIIKKEIPNIKYLIPATKYCTDNAVMVGAAAYFHYLRGETKNWENIEVNANLRLN